MTSSDVRDVLNIPDGFPGEARPSKKQKLSAPRPNLKGLAREVHLLGGDNPIAIVPEVTQFKKRRLASRKPATRWEMRAFKNSGRGDDSLVLRHWRRKEEKPGSVKAVDEKNDATINEGTQPNGADANDKPAAQGDEQGAPIDLEDSTFAKFNVQIQVPQYSDDQYNASLQNENWTKEETDYIMSLAREFDLRWPLIWDRYEWNPPAMNGETNLDGDESKAIIPTVQNRSMEDLKARYYEIAAKMMAIQKPVQYMTQPEFALHELMTHFNPAQERARKDFAINSLNRSPEEAREEESLLLEVKRILARSERFNEERRELYRRLDYPHSEQDISAFRSSAGLQTLLQNLMTVDKSKKRKSLMGVDGVSPGGSAPLNSTPAAHEASNGRRESTVASTGRRESTAPVQTPTTGNKKGQLPATHAERRKLTEQEEAIYGVTHFDRLGSGPTFRTERINKLFSHKSGQQQLRINNALNELDVPSKLAMPTASTTQAYESLLAAVNGLLDARKHSDKIDAELKIEEAKALELDKVLHPEKHTKREGDDSQAEEKKQGEASVVEGETDPKKGAEVPPLAETAQGATAESHGQDQTQKEDTKYPNTDGPALGETNEKEFTGRPGSSSANHKRSASVLSSVSNQSAKRQKK